VTRSCDHRIFWKNMTKSTATIKVICYKSPKKEMVFHTFKHLIQNLKSYNEIKV